MIMFYKSKTRLPKALCHWPILLAFFAGALIYGGITQKANAEFVFGTPEAVPNVNYALNPSQYSDLEVDISSDGLELYFRSNRPGGYGNWDLYVAKRDSIFHPWKTPENLGGIVNDAYHVEGPSISSDGLELYFSSSRPGAVGWEGVDTDYDIWVTKRATKDSPWQTPMNLSEINSTYFDLFPSISSDGLEIYFDSRRPGGQGYTDIWVAKRSSTRDFFGVPENAGPIINSTSTDNHPCISSDDLVLLFNSPRRRTGVPPSGSGIFVSTRETKSSEWGYPKLLGPLIDTSISEKGASLSADGKMLYFNITEVFDSPPPYWIADTYQMTISPVLDFNADGEVDSQDLGILESYLGEEGDHVAYVDIYPSPIGDGRINEKDMEVFLEESSKEDRLMAYWKLDEEGSGELVGRGKSVTYDEISGFDGIVYGKPVWLDEGKVDGALLLDGVDDYIKLPFVWNPAYGEFSAFAWVNGGDLGQGIISQTDDSLGRYGTIWLGIDSLEKKLITGLTDLSRSTECPLVSELEIPENNWNHVGFVWDGARSLSDYLT